ncbi:hypothetical protein PybrP1_010910 [[Pythium] brassicae (nom. inval.)]|nr:hypothetical protein PybrP1_010910 [[Pythium] brassicae (nom. inval.)]
MMKRGRGAPELRGGTRSSAAAAAAGGRPGLRRKNIVEDEEEEEEEEEDDDASAASDDGGDDDNDDDDDNEEEAKASARAAPRKKVARAAKTSARRKVKQQQRQEANDDDDDDDELEEEDEEEEEEEEEEADGADHDDDDDDEEEEEEEEATAAAAATVKAKPGKGRGDAVAPPRRKSERKPPPPPPPPRAPPTKRQARLLDAKKKLLTPTKSRNRIAHSSGDDDDDDEDEDEDDDGNEAAQPPGEQDGGSDGEKSGDAEERTAGGSARKKPRRAGKAVASAAHSGDDDGRDAPADMDVDEQATPPTPEQPPPLRRKVSADDQSEDEAKSESSVPTAASTPAASPVRRKDISMSALMNSSPSAPPKSAEPDAPVLTAVCNRVLKDGKSPSRLVSVGILSAVRDDPERFSRPSVLKYLLRLLRSKHYVGAKDAAGAADAALKKAAAGSADMDEWPVDSVKVFLDDSLYSRMWVDHELSQLFVRNVKSILLADSDAVMGSEEVEEGKDTSLVARGELVRRRFHGAQVFQDMRDLVVNHLRARLGEMDKEKPGAAGGGSLCKSTDPTDLYTVDVLLKMRLKSTLFQVKVETISQLVRQHPAYLKLALAVYVARERPNNMGKDVDNMKIVQQIFRAARAAAVAGADELFYKTPVAHQGTLASRQLGLVLRELSSAPDMAPVLKTVVRKILKQITFEQVDILALCAGLLENDGHWDAIATLGDARVADYMSLVTGIVWLALLVRGAAVKSMQIQQSSAAGRHGASPGALSGALKLGGSGPIPRRGMLPIGAQRVPKLVPRDSKTAPVGGSKAKPQAASGSSSLAGSALGGGGASSSAGAAAGGAAAVGGVQAPPQADATKTVKVAVRAKEELLQAMASVQLQAVASCRELLQRVAAKSADASLEKLLYETVVKRVLFLEIPADVQPTDHDRVCFQFTKEEIPLHDATLGALAALYRACPSVSRLEALRTIETVVVRAAEGQVARETLWRTHGETLTSYAAHGGVVGLEVKDAAFVRDLLLLAKVDVDLKLEQEFCHSSRFWISCAVLLIVGCFNPNTVGEYLWRTFPTLRGLMQMAITGRYAFPPVDALDPALFGRHTGRFPDLRSGNQQLADYEQQVAQHAQVAALFDDPPMVLEVDGLARQPPPAILEHLRSLDLKFKLGTRLRQSRASDFLMEMVTGNDAWSSESGSPDSVWWIADIVCEDFDTVQYLPHGCLCKLLLLAYRSSDAATSRAPAAAAATAAPPPGLSQLIPRLLATLRAYVAATDDTSGTAANVVLYFLDCLTSSDVPTRRVASHILQLLTSNAPPDDETPQSTPAASDIESVDDDASDADTKRVRDADTMSFAWLPALAQLPCYSGIRERVFWSLESILERESSVQSLTLCVKALHAFWKESADVDGKAPDAADDSACSKQRSAALEQTLVLAGAFSKLLAGREFVAAFLLEQRDVYAILLEVLWAAIKQQLAVPPSLKAKMGVSFSDCKVFYVADGSNGVREIRLPLHVVHGALHVLCSPHATETPDRLVAGGSLFVKLKQSLFPKAASSAAILSSTGLIATKDPRLYPDGLLLKLAASTPNAHLCVSAVRAMKGDTLWKLVLRTGLRELCLGFALHALHELTRTNESRAVSGLTAATATEDLADAARVLHRQLSAYAGDDSCVALSAPTAESLRRVREWLAAKCSSGSDASMDADESADERLLCRAFSTARVARAARAPLAPATLFFASRAAKPPLDAVVLPTSLESSPDRQRGGVQQLLREHFALEESDAASVRFDKEPRGDALAAALVNAIESSCDSGERQPTGRGGAPANTWGVRIALLRSLQASCMSREHASTLASALLAVVGHVSRCASVAHRGDCCDFLRQALRNFDSSLSYSAAAAFVRGIVQVEVSADLSELADPSTSIDVQHALRTIAAFVATTLARWKATGFALALDALTVRSVVVLVKDLRILELAGGAEEGAGPPGRLDATSAADDRCVAVDLLCALMGEQHDERVLVSVLDAVLTADPHFEQLRGTVVLHAGVRREMIGIVYFQNPLAVAPHLDTLLPGWESLVDLEATALSGLSARTRTTDRKLVGFVDDVLRDLSHESSDATDRFREIATRYPLLILHAMDIVRPHLRAQPGVFATLCKFLIELLEVVATHQASEFHTLVARALGLCLDALFADFDAASEQLFQPERAVVLQSVAGLYASHPDVRAFGELVAQRHSEPRVRAAMAALDAARNRHSATPAATGAPSADQYRDVELFVARSGAAAGDELSGAASEQLCQAIDQLCASVQQLQTAASPLLRRCAEPLSRLLFAGSLTKATMSRICQTLLHLMKADAASLPRGVDAYVRCLRTLRPGLKETAVAYVLEFLTLANNLQRRRILQQLFDDPSDIAKSKLVAYLKSSAFKSSLLPFARVAVEQSSASTTLQ